MDLIIDMTCGVDNFTINPNTDKDGNVKVYLQTRLGDTIDLILTPRDLEEFIDILESVCGAFHSNKY
ncbi:hypothetical protein [Metabacillus sp. Hm71]|uniref:hypothetical protein n=1 Tax=Metabacillus sp. Hm71 TaxID=3450743 RepID=UPI003F41E3CE